MTAGALVGRAAASYADRYQSDPEGVWFAPGRANLIGEHTDYNGGFVLPFALGSGVAAAAGRHGSGITVWSRQRGDGAIGVPPAALVPGSATGWAAYPLGMAWSLAEAGYRPGATSMAIDSDLAMGAGLSSSAALECAVALALTELHGLDVSRAALVTLASKAENEFAGAPTGIMDQSAALLCTAGHALLLDCRSGATEPVPFDPASAGLEVLLIDTGARHALTDGRYGDRRRECEAAARQLGMASLRELTDDPGAVARLADPVLRRRARHVLTENQRVLTAAGLLRAGQLAAVGPLLTQSHHSLRDDFEVSWPQADVAVEAVLAAGGAGARMMGGGFGGSVIALTGVGQGPDVAAAIAAAFALQGWPAPSVATAVPSQAARRLR